MRSTLSGPPVIAALGLSLLLGLSGCTGNSQPSAHKDSAPANQSETAAADAEIAAERAKLSPEDRALVDAQEWCVVSNEERLGGMGAPIKLSIKGQPVFICCKGCKRKAEADPDKTLAKLEELKARKRAAGAPR